MNKDPLLLYVHVPFCVHKCGYCDFNSWAETSRGPQELWAGALKSQILFWKEHIDFKKFEFATVFFGGGTPSLLSDDLLIGICEELRSQFQFASNAEWSLEANPETLTLEKLNTFEKSGFNRISIGLQSFEDRFLERLERRARRVDNLRALELVAKHWKGRWSGDLMFALPHQTLQQWDDDLKTLLDFAPRHVSAYQLTLSTSRSQNWSQAPEDELIDFFNCTEQKLGESGLQRYEVSNFAHSGNESQHNLGYWRLTPFLGLGPGAAGLLPQRIAHSKSPYGVHQKNPDKFENWVAQAGTFAAEMGSNLKSRACKDHLFEMLMMGLRTSEGIDMERLKPWDQLLREGVFARQITDFIQVKEERLKCSPKGIRILDNLLPQIYKNLEKNWDANLDLSCFDPKF